MQNKPQVDTSHAKGEIQVPPVIAQAPTPQFYENPASWISLLALWVSYLNFRRTGRIAQATIFDKRFGDDLRSLSRKLERELKELNAFIYPSQKSIDDQKIELQSVRPKIEDVGHQIMGILRELDQARDIEGNDWLAQFERHSLKADEIFSGISGLSNAQDALFSSTVNKAREHWQTAIDQMRRRLEKTKIQRKILKS